VIDYGKKEWVVDALITGTELRGMKGYDHAHLPRSVPQFPIVSMDHPNILYFVLRGSPVPTNELTTWIVTLDMKRKEVLRYDRIIDFQSDGNISSGFGIFPSNFSNYLTKHTTTKV
jgi:hypothetical protein